MDRTLALTAVFAIAPLAIHAEEPNPGRERADVVAASREVFRDADMVVVGSPETRRGVEVLEDTPIETQWVTKDEIDALPARNAADVVQYLAGIRTTQRIQGQDAAVSIEGMPVEYTEILVDGQRFSGEVGGAGDLADFSLENVERIEVLRGTQGARYGTTAAGGVINVVTKSPPSEGWRVALQSEGGTDDMALGGGTVAGRVGPLGLSLSGLYQQIDGFGAPHDGDVVLAQPGGQDSRNHANFLYGKWDAPLGENLTARGNGLWRVEHDDVVFDNDVTRESSNLTNTNWRTNAGLDWQPREGTNVASDLTWYAVDTDSQVGRSFNLFEDELDGNLYAEHEIETGPLFHTLRGGAELQWQRLDQHERDPFESDSGAEIGQAHLDETFFAPSIFLQSESSLGDWLTVVLAVRGQFHSQFDPKALPQVAVLLRPFESLSLRASWGLNYRTPSLRDLYQPPSAQLGGAYFLAGNENLKAESSSSIRAGFEWSPRDWVSVASTGFYNDIDDYIRSQFDRELVLGRETRLVPAADTPQEQAICRTQFQFFPDDPTSWTPECEAFFYGRPIERTFLVKAPLYVKQNLDSVRTWGVESQLRLRISSYAQVSLAYTWLKTKVVQSNVDIDELPNEPEHTVGARTTLISPWWDTQITTALRWSSGVIPEGSGTGLLSFADPSRKTDPSYQLDFRLAQPFDGALSFHGIRLHFDALNVTDERRQDSYAIRGRSFVAGISGEFGSAR